LESVTKDTDEFMK